MLKNRYHFDIFKIFSGNLLGQIVGLLTIPVITRLYSPESYGEYIIYLQLAVACSIFLSLRFEHLLILSDSYEQAVEKLKVIALLSFFMFLFFFVVFMVFYREINDILPSSPSKYVVVLVLFTGLLVSYSYGMEQVLQKRALFFRSTFGDIVSKVSFFIFSVAFFFIDFNVYGLIFSYFIAVLLKALYFNLYLYQDFLKRNTSLRISGLKEVGYRAFGLVYSHTLLVFSQLIPLHYISKGYGGAILGQYSLAFSTLNMIVLLGAQSMGKVYFQRMSGLEDKKLKKRLWLRTFKISLMLAVPIYFFIYLVSDWVYPFVFGEEWADSGRIAKVLLFSSFFAFISRPMESTSLCLNIWWYSPLWHSFRTFLILLFFYFLDSSLPLDELLPYYVAILVFIYIVDLVLQRVFIEVK